ncbi:MAG: DUF4838 domain-containing protein [Armatimonadota bacterium]
MLKVLNSSLIMAAIVCTAVGGVCADDIPGKGGMMYTISAPEVNGKAMNFAANELAKYCKEITGSEYQVSIEPSPSKDACIRLDVDGSLKHDAYRIRSEGDVIKIFGGSSRGCLYGVYAFLGELGCKWPLPSKEYEFIPKLSKIKWNEPEIKSEPAVRRRGMVLCVGESTDDFIVTYVDFMAKHGFNYLFTHIAGFGGDVEKMLIDAMDVREIGFEFGGHLLPGLLPRDLFEEHPEYFRMENGKRVRDLNMCPSSEGAADIVAENAKSQINYIRKFSKPETLHLWADDIPGGGWCSCDKCKDLTSTDQTIKSLNNIAERLDLGETMLGFCSYHGSVYPPKSINASDGVRLVYAPRERCYRHALGECEANRRYLDYVKELAVAIPKEPEIFEYYHDCILLRYMSVPLHETIGKDVKAYLQAGIDGIGSLSFQNFSDWAYGPNTYTLAKALWRGEGSPSDIGDYCSELYGPAAKPMREYFDLLSEVSSTAMETCGYPDGVDLRVPPTHEYVNTHIKNLEPLVSEEHLDKIEGKLRQALNVGREPYRTRVEEQLVIWEFTRAEVKNIHNQLIIGSRISRLLAGKGTDDELTDTINRLETLIPNLAVGTKMIQEQPDRLRGWFASAKSGAAIEERSNLYKPTLDAWLTQLKGLRDK